MVCIVPSFATMKLFLYRFKFQIFLGIATLALLAWALPGLLWGPMVTTVQVVQRDFVYTIVASGHVENPHRVEIGTSIVGTVLRVPVNEGQTVQAQQLLLSLENAELLANAKQAEFAVMQAKARLRQVRDVQAPVAEQTLGQAHTNEAAALRSFERSQMLFDKGFIGQAALDEAQRLALIAQSQVVSLKEQVASLHEGGSDLWAAQTNLSQAQAS